MPANLTNSSGLMPQTSEPTVVSGELRCALTGRLLRPDEAYWAPPLITTRQLVITLFQTLLRTPSNLGQVLLSEQPNVPYAPEARPRLATRRSTEQLKLLVLLLCMAALLITPIILIIP